MAINVSIYGSLEEADEYFEQPPPRDGLDRGHALRTVRRR